MTKFFYIIPGILTPRDDPRTWNYQAQAWLRDWAATQAMDAIEVGFGYADGIVGATLALESQAALIAADLNKAFDAGNEITIVGHSNGCRLAIAALMQKPYRYFPVRLHLLAAATDADCNANGLNTLAAANRIAHLSLYISHADEVLGISPLVSYGRLGKDGPANASNTLSDVMDEIFRDCLHCDWVTKDFESTMELIARQEST